jgi:predicted nucleotidyltransferase
VRSSSPSPSPIADALFGKTRQRVLALLFGVPERRVFLRQIARLAGTGLGAVQREVARMTEAGLLIREREGQQMYYRANPDSPVINELRDLMRKTAGAADVIRDALGTLSAPVQVAAIIGSFATGTEHAGSDVDVLVIGEATFGDVVDALAPAERALGREINPAVFAPDEYARKLRDGNHFLSSLNAQTKLFVIGDEHELAAMAGGADVNVLRLVTAKRDAILAAASRRGARHVRLFGSVVRGEARGDSDVDFLVDLDRGRSLLDLGGLLVDLEAILGRKVDVVTPAGLRPRVRASVLKDARPL